MVMLKSGHLSKAYALRLVLNLRERSLHRRAGPQLRLGVEAQVLPHLLVNLAFHGFQNLREVHVVEALLLSVRCRELEQVLIPGQRRPFFARFLLSRELRANET